MFMGPMVAEPLSVKQIQEKVALVRDIFNLSDCEYIDIVSLLERDLVDVGINFEVKTKQEMGDDHGKMIPEKSGIYIREDVYNRACEGCERDRMTIAHEIGHLFLHSQNAVSFARADPKRKHPAYRDPEWQANVFAGELLAPAKTIKGLSVVEVQRTYGISSQAARIQLRR